MLSISKLLPFVVLLHCCAENPLVTRMKEISGPWKLVVSSPHHGQAFKAYFEEQKDGGSKYLAKVVEILGSHNVDWVVVGGCVRDQLIGEPSKDIDFNVSVDLVTMYGILQKFQRKELEEAAARALLASLDIDAVIAAKAAGGEQWENLPDTVKEAWIPIGINDAAVFVGTGPDDPNNLDLFPFADGLYDGNHVENNVNSMVYDPVSQSIVDPFGTGLKNIASKKFAIVADSWEAWFEAKFPGRPNNGKTIRLLKMLAKGFSLVEGEQEKFVQVMNAHFKAGKETDLSALSIGGAVKVSPIAMVLGQNIGGDIVFTKKKGTLLEKRQKLERVLKVADNLGIFWLRQYYDLHLHGMENGTSSPDPAQLEIRRGRDGMYLFSDGQPAEGYVEEQPAEVGQSAEGYVRSRPVVYGCATAFLRIIRRRQE